MIRTLISAAVLGAVAFAAPAQADLDVHVNITPPSFGFEAPPRLVVVPGQPRVHYAPDVSVNFFSYGGRYYTYDQGNWFVAGHDRGPWTHVDRGHVPFYVRSVPSRYYRVPPRNVGRGHWEGKRRGHGKHSKHDDRRDNRQRHGRGD